MNNNKTCDFKIVKISSNNGHFCLDERYFDIFHGVLEKEVKLCFSSCRESSKFCFSNGFSLICDCSESLVIDDKKVWRPDFNSPLPFHLIPYQKICFDTENYSEINILVSTIDDKRRSLLLRNGYTFHNLSENNYTKIIYDSGMVGTCRTEPYIIDIIPLCENMSKNFNHVWKKVMHLYYENDKQNFKDFKYYEEYLKQNCYRPNISKICSLIKILFKGCKLNLDKYDNNINTLVEQDITTLEEIFTECLDILLNSRTYEEDLRCLF